MRNQKHSLWIESEACDTFNCDISNDNTDVVVTFENNDRWMASFFTYNNIQKMVEKNKCTGECLNGKYFWSSDMILVDEVSRTRIEEVIEHLLNENDFECTFRKIEATE